MKEEESKMDIGVEYHENSNLVTVSSNQWVAIMNTDMFHKAMQKAAKEYIKDLKTDNEL